MVNDAYSIFEIFFKAWFKGDSRMRRAIGAATIMVGLAIIVAGLGNFSLVDKRIGDLVSAVLGVCAALLALAVIARQNFIDKEARNEKIEAVEQRVRENPEKPELAWDLARTRLESYLDRNLGQVRSIYWLTLVVMFVGFGFVLYGLYESFQAGSNLPVSLIASASGVIISFLGGSFLLIYRSVLAQSRDYVSVLERINAVGMAVQVISSLPDDSIALRDQATAKLAEQLLGLYAATRQ